MASECRAAYWDLQPQVWCCMHVQLGLTTYICSGILDLCQRITIENQIMPISFKFKIQMSNVKFQMSKAKCRLFWDLPTHGGKAQFLFKVCHPLFSVCFENLLRVFNQFSKAQHSMHDNVSLSTIFIQSLKAAFQREHRKTCQRHCVC